MSVLTEAEQYRLLYARIVGDGDRDVAAGTPATTTAADQLHRLCVSFGVVSSPVMAITAWRSMGCNNKANDSDGDIDDGDHDDDDDDDDVVDHHSKSTRMKDLSEHPPVGDQSAAACVELVVVSVSDFQDGLTVLMGSKANEPAAAIAACKRVWCLADYVMLTVMSTIIMFVVQSLVVFLLSLIHI